MVVCVIDQCPNPAKTLPFIDNGKLVSEHKKDMGNPNMMLVGLSETLSSQVLKSGVLLINV